jgi:tRNA(Arg) A34 adenosine deaminase TadA
LTEIALIDNEHFMRLAIELARNNPRAPFGTLIVDVESQEVAAEGLNRAREHPIMHGELDAIDRYAKGGCSGWGKLRLYTTAEPCCMCQAAIIWAGIPEVVFGTSIATLIELGWNQFDLTAADVASRAKFARCEIIGGVLANECDQLFKQARG